MAEARQRAEPGARARRIRSLAVLAAVGCSVSRDAEDSFGTPGPATAATSVSTTAGPDDGGSSGEASSGGTGSAASGDASTGTPAPSESSGGGPLDGSSSADDGTGTGMQPQDGMYSHCLLPGDCVGANLCITITPPGATEPSTGFCSQNGCADPMTSCSTNPGGTATPACVAVTVNMMPDQACALDCTGGLTCPAPMVCMSVTGFGFVCA